MFAHSFVLVNHSEWNVSTNPGLGRRVGEGTQAVGAEFEERGSRTWVFVRTWRRYSFYRVAVGVIDRYHGDASSELVILGQVLCAIGSGASLVSISGGSHTLVECYKEYLGAGACADCWTIQLLTSGCSNTAYKKLLPLSLGRSMLFRWLNSSWPDWKALSIVIGCIEDNLCDVQLRQVMCLFLGW